MKQTAVEWYAEQEVMLTLDLLAKKINDVEYSLYKLELFNKAKEMEKEQIMNCSIQTTQDCYVAIMKHLNAPLQFTDEDLSNQKLEAEQYYNETFKSE